MASSRTTSIEQFLKISDPEIQISDELLAYIQEIVRQCQYEVSWVMEVEEFPNYIYQIQGVYLPRQEVHETTTEFDAIDIMELCTLEPDFKPEKWRGWGHSHVNMPVSPSDQDKKQMMKFAEACTDSFFIGMIHNKAGEVFCWLVDNKRKIFFRDVILHVISRDSGEVKKLIKERVSLIKSTPKAYGGFGGWENDGVGFHRATPTYQAMGSTVEINGIKIKKTTKTFADSKTPRYGYEIDGQFYDGTRYFNATEAYNAYLKELVKEFKTKNPSTPSTHDMPIFTELEDWNKTQLITSL